MDVITRKELATLLAARPGPCVSLFQPTHRGGNEQDRLCWKNLLGQAQNGLEAMPLRAPEARKLLEPARNLLEDPLFWKNQCDGLACFLAADGMWLYRLPQRFEEQAIVADRFHVTPLLPLLSGNGRFYVLALSQNAVRLMQGTRDSIHEIDLTRVPHSLAEAMLTHDKDEPLTYHTRPTSGGTWGCIFSGHGVGIDDAKDDLVRYFRQIDKGLHAYLREEHAPLLLAAVGYLHPLYRQANTYAGLLEEGIEGNPDRLSGAELHDRAWSLVRPAFEAAEYEAAARYRQLAGTGRTASELAEVVPASHRGEVETLFLSSGKPAWGRFDLDTGKAELHERAEPGDEDLLNLAAIHTLQHGKTVYAVEPARVPNGSSVAAIYCLPLPKHGKRP